MFYIKHTDFEDAIKTLDIIVKMDKRSLKKRYLELSKIYHPDVENGDIEKFQKLNDAYKLLSSYIENYRFSFTMDEFEEQHPFSQNKSSDWFYGF
jgi:DnaJ-class molecular chaperone